MYMDGPILQFMDKLASGSPEPGGGAACALASAIGAALVSMVANLTVGKEKYSDVQDRIAGLLESAESVRRNLQELVQKDTEVYGVLSKAFKMPRETGEEKSSRKKAIQEALLDATMVPYQIAENALEVARLSELAAEIGNVNAVSDAGVAVLLADAGAQSAALNVKINLASIEDKAFADEKWSAIEDILSNTAGLKNRVLKTTYEKLG
ncbi:MAG: cyclodeaminase/cyclohydrolase family protein [Actinobacteria bacterium]|nr:cyclodeaminase/cyclohydrolase family protein [Actinomycetota bacterium]